MSKRQFDPRDLNDETLEKLEILRQAYRLDSVESTIKFLVDCQINEGMMNMTGGAKARQYLNLHE